MSLDGFVCCNCIREGKAKPHPFPDRLTFDEIGEPMLTGDPTQDEWEAHDEWVADPCEHGGFLLSLFLGNVTRVKNLRGFLGKLEDDPGPKFPILLEKVLYDGTHTGDWVPSDETAALLKEVETRIALARYSLRLRKRVLREHEAAVRGQHCDGQCGHVLSAARTSSPRIHADERGFHSRPE